MANITHDDDGHPLIGPFEVITDVPARRVSAAGALTMGYGLSTPQDRLTKYLPEKAGGALEGTPAPSKGRKDDSGKVRMELLNDVSRAIKGLAEVLTWAVTKKEPVPYEPGSWLNVDDFHNRYFGALLRHVNNVQKNGYFAKDKETTLLDMKHVLTNAAFLVEKLERELEA